MSLESYNIQDLDVEVDDKGVFGPNPDQLIVGGNLTRAEFIVLLLKTGNFSSHGYLKKYLVEGIRTRLLRLPFNNTHGTHIVLL